MVLFGIRCGGIWGPTGPPGSPSAEPRVSEREDAAAASTAQEAVESEDDGPCATPKGIDWYHCAGARRGAGPIAEDLRTIDIASRRDIDDLAELSGRLNLRASATPLLRVLERWPAPDDDPNGRIRLFEQRPVALALADLEHAEAVSTLVSLLVWSEDISSLHEAVLEAVRRLDPKAAADYGRDLVARRIPDLDTVYRRAKARLLIPIFVEAEATDMLGVLEKWMFDASARRLVGGHTEGRIAAAMILLGHKKLGAHYRRWLGDSSLAVPAYPHHTIAALGAHRDDVPAMSRFAGGYGSDGRAGYEAINRYIDLVERARESGDPSLRSLEKGLEKLHRSLRKLTKFRDEGQVNNGKPGFMYNPVLQARHHAALFRLGDATSGDTLAKLASGTPSRPQSWVAATLGLRYRVEGTSDAAVALLESAAGPASNPKLWTRRVELLDAFVEAGDAEGRWVAALFDRHPLVRDRAAFHFAREQPTSFCTGFERAARIAAQKPDPIGAWTIHRLRDAMWPITTVEAGVCAENLRALVSDTEARKELRANALMLLAIDRDLSFVTLAREFGPQLREDWVTRAQSMYRLRVPGEDH